MEDHEIIPLVNHNELHIMTNPTASINESIVQIWLENKNHDIVDLFAITSLDVEHLIADKPLRDNILNTYFWGDRNHEDYTHFETHILK